MNDIPIPLLIILGIVAVIVGPWVAIKLIGLLGFGVVHIFRFIGGVFSDVARIVGSIVTTLVFVPLVVINILIGRWSASAHFGRAISSEVRAAVAAMYRIAIGHPARLLGLGAAVEGLEQRVPQVMAAAPTRDKPHKARAGAFDGYAIIGSLAGGGSGGKLYVAEPTPEKHAAFERSGHTEVDQVVIKTFSLEDGSSLPQIVRENRALAAAKNMGLVLEHDMTPTRFHYVMRYVPGKPLGQVAQEFHARSSSDGLGQADLQTMVGYVADLTSSLAEYHQGGLWHKDVKPDNIIVDSKSAHLVDFGLITPLRSAMTLTTHGTEYFRDPEMVRMALRGAKVHEVNGAKFDIYAAGAVLYAVIENSFPAHGALSQFSKPCPDALRWIIRRSMTDYDKRYASAAEMLADLRTVLASGDIASLRPADLPSVKGGANVPVPEIPVAEPMEIVDEALAEPAAAFAASTPPPQPGQRPRYAPPPPGASPQQAPAKNGNKPRIRVTNWWTGEWKADGGAPDSQPVRVARAATPRVPKPKSDLLFVAAVGIGGKSSFNKRLNAREQVRAARKRAANTRKNAANRISKRRPNRYDNNLNWGTFLAVLCAIGFVGGIGFALTKPSTNRTVKTTTTEILAGARAGQGPSVIVTVPEHVGPTGTVHPAVAISELTPELLDGIEGAEVLFLSDLLPPLDESLLAPLEAAHAQLTLSGVHTISAMTTDGDDPLDSEEVDALASLSRKRGQLTLGSDSTSRAISSWLEKHGHADAVVWLGSDEKLYIFTQSSRTIGPVSDAANLIHNALVSERHD